MEISSPLLVAQQTADAVRLSAIVSFTKYRILVRVEIPQQDCLVPSIVTVTKENGSWAISGSVEAEHALESVDGTIIYAASVPGGSSIFRRSSDGSREELATLPGRVSALVGDGSASATWALVRESFAHTSDSPWFLTNSVLMNAGDASIGTARRNEGVVSIWSIDTAARTAQRLDIDHAVLTGEATCSAGRLVVGAVQSTDDGNRRFGLVTVLADGGTVNLFPEGFDLSSPCGRPELLTLACLATRRPEDIGEVPWQSSCIVSPCLGGVTILRDAGLWDAPLALLDESSVLSVGERFDRRMLFRRERGAQAVGAQHGESVLHASASEGNIAAIVSSPGRSPELRVGAAESWFSGGSTLKLPFDQEITTPGKVTYRRRNEDIGSSKITTGMWIAHPNEGASSSRGLVVVFHGGPMKNWANWSWRWNPWPFVVAGFTVALADPPMSLGYGDSAVAAGWRNWREGVADRAVRDITALRSELGLGHRPLVVMGGSFGGYLALATAEALRPELIVTHAAPVDLGCVAGSSDVGWQWRREFGAPWESLGVYDDSTIDVSSVPISTRLLISHGINDDLVLVQESLRVFRQHRARGSAGELLVFRDEGHPVLRPRNLLAWYGWVLSGLEGL